MYENGKIHIAWIQKNEDVKRHILLNDYVLFYLLKKIISLHSNQTYYGSSQES